MIPIALGVASRKLRLFQQRAMNYAPVRFMFVCNAAPHLESVMYMCVKAASFFPVLKGLDVAFLKNV